MLTLTNNTALRLYGPALWRDKAYSEARGLVVNTALITNWYGYYLMRNRTYYGKPVLVDTNFSILADPVDARIGPDLGFTDRNEGMIHFSQISTVRNPEIDSLMPLYQTGDGLLHARKGILAPTEPTSLDLGARIRVSSSWKNLSRVFLTERGDVWFILGAKTWRATMKGAARITRGTDFVDIVATDKERFVVLDRGGTTHELDIEGTVRIYHKLVGDPPVRLEDPIVELGPYGFLTRSGVYYRHFDLNRAFEMPATTVQKYIISLGLGELNTDSSQEKEPVKKGFEVKLLLPAVFDRRFIPKEPVRNVISYYTSVYLRYVWIDTARQLSSLYFPPLVGAVQFIEPVTAYYYLLLVDYPERLESEPN